MNINDDSVLEMINTYIAYNRLSKIQILQLIKLAPISNDIKELKDNINWEYIKSKH